MSSKNRQQKTVRMDEWQIEAIEQVVENAPVETDFSKVVRSALRKYIDELSKGEPEQLELK